jgi:hypothetical protein
VSRIAVPELDFSRPQPVLGRVAPWAGWLLLAVALALAGWLAADHVDRLARRDAAELQLRRALAPQVRSAADANTLAAEIRFADAALAPGRIPWEQVFAAVEGAAAAQVAVLRMHPRGAAREIHVAGEAADADALSAYLARLGARPGVARVRLLGHQPLGAAGPGLRFELVVDWGAP